MPGRIKAVLAEFDDLTFQVHDFTDVPLDECLRRVVLGRRSFPPAVGEARP